MTRKIVLNVQTTGLHPEEGHRIIEIGCLEMVGYELTGYEFHAYINPLRSSSPSAFRLHGVSDDFLKTKPEFYEIVPEMLSFFGGDELIMYNSKFDLGFMESELSKDNLSPDLIGQIKAIGVLDIVRSRNDIYGRDDLISVCRRLGVEHSVRTKTASVSLKKAELIANLYTTLMVDTKEVRARYAGCTADQYRAAKGGY